MSQTTTKKPETKFKVSPNQLNEKQSFRLPKDAESVIPVFKTYDYDAFKFMRGNRPTKPSHIEKLIQSFNKKQLMVPIIVNEKLEVIDGQHRLSAAKELNKPIYFIILNGYGLEEIKQLNTNQDNWTPDSYAKSYCEQGYQSYIEYRDFRLRWGFGHQESVALLANTTVNLSKQFNEGDFKVKDLNEANRIAQMIKDFLPYYKGVRRKSFVYSIISLSKNPEYNHKEMIEKVRIQPRAMVDCVSVQQYLEMMAEIYNYHRRGKKIYFD